MNVRGGLRIFSVNFWHSEGWTPRNEALLEAVLKRTGTTKNPWLIACDANMSPEDFERSLWFLKDRVSRCRSKNAKGEWVEKVFDYVIGCNSLKGKISQMNVEEFESRPHKAVTFCSRKRKGEAGMERAKTAEGVTWIQWRTVARKEHKREQSKEEIQEDEGGEERRTRDQIKKEVIAGIQKKAIDEGVEKRSKENRRAKPHAKLRLLVDLNEEEEESWQEGVQRQRSGVKNNIGTYRDGRKP